MNLQEIIAEVNKNVDDDLEVVDVIGWVNRCIEDLIPVSTNQSLITIEIFADQSQYELPTDFIRVKQVVIGGNTLRQLALNDTSSCGYKIYANKIILQPTPNEDGSFDMYYEANLPYLSDLEDIPQIPVFFHDLFVLYAIAKRMYQDDEPERQMNAWSEYKNRKQEYIRYIRRSTIEPIRDVYGIRGSTYGY